MHCERSAMEQGWTGTYQIINQTRPLLHLYLFWYKTEINILYHGKNNRNFPTTQK